MEIENLFKERAHRRLTDGVYNCLPEHLEEIKKIDAETYDHRAQFFDQEKCLEMGRPEFTDPFRAYPKDSSVFLEVAGGSAVHALNMMKDGYRVIESDISEGSVKKSKYFAEQLGFSQNGYWAMIDAENLPFQDGSLTGVWMIASLHHLPHPQQAIDEAYRTLQDGGCFIIGYEPAKWQYIAFYPLILVFRTLIRLRNRGRPTSKADDVTFGFTKRSLQKMLERAGFSDIQINPVYYTYKSYKNYRILVSKLKRKPFRESSRVKSSLVAFDKKIARVPGLRSLTWDWDCVGYKPLTNENKK